MSTSTPVLDGALSRRQVAGLAVLAVLGVGLVVLLLALGVNPATFAVETLVMAVSVVDASYVRSALRLAVPIAFAALGGIFAEKSGVINIGLEGLLIVAAFTGVAVVSVVGGGGTAAWWLPWLGFLVAVLASTLFAGLFAVVCIRYEADQIIAGLAVWLIALGLAPFASTVLWGTVNSPSVRRLSFDPVPLVGAIPYLQDVTPGVVMMLLAVPFCWHVLFNTRYGHWVRASGENPKALDTAGVSVARVRYASVLLSGVFSGIGGASLAVGQVGQFIGSGTTMVSGRGWIAITAYLFGNYNPLGAFLASFLFAGLNAMQVRLQQIPQYGVPDPVIGMIPYVTVIVVLALVGRTRTPEAAGEHYDSGEE